MILSDNKIEVTEQMMKDEGFVHNNQVGIPCQDGVLIWKLSSELTDKDFELIERYFLNKNG